VQWYGSIALGGLLGGVSGFLLGKLEVFLLPWSTIVGALAGAVMVLAVLAFRGKIKAYQLLGPAGIYHVVRYLSSRKRSSISDGEGKP
jgi:hypothetical protein